ncbi:MAG: hypothetical protein AAB488_01325 [Patescibacteria group bacterium]
MDNKKDNPDTKGQKTEATTNNFPVNLFDIGSIIKKTQKISTATYLLTEHIEISDPVRGRMRECAIIILKDIYTSSHVSAHKDKRDRLTRLAQMIEEMAVLFEIMLLTKMVSQNNHAIICQELTSLKEMILKGGIALDGHIVFPKKLFEELEISLGGISDTEPSALLKKRGNILRGEEKNIYKGQNNNVLYLDDIQGVPRKTSEAKFFMASERSRNKRVNTSYNNSNQNVSLGGAPSKNKGDRRLHILKLIRKNRDLSIKDIYNSFTEISEKTIQRELTKMVKDRVIIRKGDKRWSRYSSA